MSKIHDKLNESAALLGAAAAQAEINGSDTYERLRGRLEGVIIACYRIDGAEYDSERVDREADYQMDRAKHGIQTVIS